MYLKLVCSKSKVFVGRVALCIPLLLHTLGGSGFWGWGHPGNWDSCCSRTCWSQRGAGLLDNQQTTELQLWRALNAGLAQLTQCGCTFSSHIVDLEPGCTDPSFSSPSAADFAFLCNGASEDSERGVELRERPRYEYGPGLEDPHYGLPSPYYNYLESEYGSPDAGFPRREPSSEFRGSPLHHGPARSPPRYLPSQPGECWTQTVSMGTASSFPPWPGCSRLGASSVPGSWESGLASPALSCCTPDIPFVAGLRLTLL